MNSYIESLLEIIYPEKNICQVCGKYDKRIGENYICYDCFKKLKKISPPHCIKCGIGIDLNSKYNLCNDCIRISRYFEQIKSPFYYDGLIKELIHDYKYCNKPFYYKLFAKLLTDYMMQNGYINFDYIISVPLHKIKQRKRGFNQTELIAISISKNLSIPYLKALKRAKNTVKQSNLSAIQRKDNLKNVFDIYNKNINNIINNKRILIIDDIFTTGATFNECSKVLLRSGAAAIYGLTIAR